MQTIPLINSIKIVKKKNVTVSAHFSILLGLLVNAFPNIETILTVH